MTVLEYDGSFSFFFVGTMPLQSNFLRYTHYSIGMTGRDRAITILVSPSRKLVFKDVKKKISHFVLLQVRSTISTN